METPFGFFATSKEEFKAFISECVAEAVEANSVNAKPAPEVEYKTRAKAAEFLHISLQTLNEKTKSGEIVGYRIGARVLYKTSELEAALVSTDRYRRTGKKTGPKPKNALA